MTTPLAPWRDRSVPRKCRVRPLLPLLPDLLEADRGAGSEDEVVRGAVDQPGSLQPADGVDGGYCAPALADELVDGERPLFVGVDEQLEDCPVVVDLFFGGGAAGLRVRHGQPP